MVADSSKKQKREFSAHDVLFKLCGVLLLALSIFLAFEDVKLFEKKQQLAAQLNDYNQQIASIKASSQQLQEQINQADNADYIEKVAREQDNMQKPGETVVSFIMPTPVNQPQAVKVSMWSGDFWKAALANAWQKVKNIF